MYIPILVINLKDKQKSLSRTYKELYKLGNLSDTITRINAIDSSRTIELKYNYIAHDAEKYKQYHYISYLVKCRMCNLSY